METIKGLSLLEEQTILSPARFVEEYHSLDDQQLVSAMTKRAAAGELEFTGSRGLHFWSDLLDKLRNREVIQDYGEQEVSIPFLSFHVPPGGKGSLTINKTKVTDTGFKLNILGLGFGQGKKISFTLNTDFGERAKCFHLVNKVLVKVTEIKTTSGRKRKYLQADILKIVDNGIVTQDVCELCQAARPEEEASETIFPAVNLSKDPTGISQACTIKLENENEFEFGFTFSVGGISLNPGILIKRSVQSECNITYHFPGGFIYHPCRNQKYDDLPYWRRE
jgi:hypothetical protein